MAEMSEGVCSTFLFHLPRAYIVSVFSVQASPVAACEGLPGEEGGGHEHAGEVLREVTELVSYLQK